MFRNRVVHVCSIESSLGDCKAVCKTVRKLVVERNKPCYNDVDFYNNTFVHEGGNMR